MTRATITPSVPGAATQVMRAARANGWKISSSWDTDLVGLPLYRLTVARPAGGTRPYHRAHIVWHLDPDTETLMLSNRVATTGPAGPWEDLVSIRVLTETIRSHPVTQTRS